MKNSHQHSERSGQLKSERSGRLPGSEHGRQPADTERSDHSSVHTGLLLIIASLLLSLLTSCTNTIAPQPIDQQDFYNQTQGENKTTEINDDIEEQEENNTIVVEDKITNEIIDKIQTTTTPSSLYHEIKNETTNETTILTSIINSDYSGDPINKYKNYDREREHFGNVNIPVEVEAKYNSYLVDTSEETPLSVTLSVCQPESEFIKRIYKLVKSYGWYGSYALYNEKGILLVESQGGEGACNSEDCRTNEEPTYKMLACLPLRALIFQGEE